MTPMASLASLSMASRDQFSLRELRGFLGAGCSSGISSTHSAPRLMAGGGRRCCREDGRNLRVRYLVGHLVGGHARGVHVAPLDPAAYRACPPCRPGWRSFSSARSTPGPGRTRARRPRRGPRSADVLVLVVEAHVGHCIPKQACTSPWELTLYVTWPFLDARVWVSSPRSCASSEPTCISSRASSASAKSASISMVGCARCSSGCNAATRNRVSGWTRGGVGN